MHTGEILPPFPQLPLLWISPDQGLCLEQVTQMKEGLERRNCCHLCPLVSVQGLNNSFPSCFLFPHLNSCRLYVSLRRLSFPGICRNTKGRHKLISADPAVWQALAVSTWGTERLGDMQSYRVHLLRPVPESVETVSNSWDRVLSKKKRKPLLSGVSKAPVIEKGGHLRLRSHININLQVLLTVSVGKLTSAWALSCPVCLYVLIKGCF